MSEFINLALRRNIFYPCNEIYPNSPAGFYDYGPLGVKIRNNIVEFWRKEFVERIDAIEIDGCQILPESVFKSSGHLDGFFDPVVKCSKCGTFSRVDKLLEKYNIIVGEKTELEILDKLILDNKINCEKCKSKFEKAFRFNMMYKLFLGIGDGNPAYLRPEACQNIFLDFARIYKGSRRNLPLPIAQIGKAFRNEIAPRNATIRGREFTQNDIEVFFDPAEINNFPIKEIENIELPVCLLDSKKDQEFIKIKDLMKKGIMKFGVEAYYIGKEYEFFSKLGFKAEEMRYKQVSPEDRPFYSLATWDFEVKTEELGWVELVANNYRTDHDLGNHQKGSKTNLEVLSNEKKVLPHVFEMSMGTDRILYTLLSNRLEGMNDKLVLKLNEPIMPYHMGIFPLVNKEGIDELAEKIFNDLTKKRFRTLYDDKGSIGKRYARIDEIGIRYAITIDYQSKEDNTVTVRDSWNTNQERVAIKDLEKYFENRLYN